VRVRLVTRLSLVPATMHVHVAEQCVQQRRNMVTASYISPGMKQLHESYVAPAVLFAKSALESLFSQARAVTDGNPAARWRRA